MRVHLLIAVLLFAAVAVAGTRPSPPTFIVDAHGNPWLVEYTPWIGCDEVGGTFVGMTDEDVHRIRLLTGRTLAQEQESVIHELFHVISGTEHAYDNVTMHQAIYQLAYGLQEVFAENPDLVRYLGTH